MTEVKIKKRSKILSILFSILMPGLGHIYNGKLLKGIIFYGLLLLTAIIPTFLFLESFSGFLIYLLINLLLIIYIISDCIILSIKNTNYNLKFINKWYIYIAFLVLNCLLNFLPINYILHNYSRFKTYSILSRSNEPTLLLNDRIFSDDWYYHFNTINRGDIVIFHNPENDPKIPLIIKRCVAISGDKVEIKDYQLYLNDKLVDLYNIKIDSKEDRLSYLKKQMSKYANNDENDDSLMLKNIIEEDKKYGNFEPQIIPENSFFCLGDNRTNSMDSRIWGSISNKALIGKLKYIYWSNDLSRIGKKFK